MRQPSAKRGASQRVGAATPARPTVPARLRPAHPGCSRCRGRRSGRRSRTASGPTGRATAGSSPPGSAAPRRCPRSSPARPRSRCWARSSALCPRGRRGGTGGRDGRGERERGGRGGGGPREVGGVHGPGLRAGPPGCMCWGAGLASAVKGGNRHLPTSQVPRRGRGRPLWVGGVPSFLPKHLGMRIGRSPCERRGPAQPSCRPRGSSGCSRRRSGPGGRAGSRRDWDRPWCGHSGSRVHDWWRSLWPCLFMPGHCAGPALSKRVVA